MKGRKRIALFLIVCFLISSLTACGSGGASSSDEDSSKKGTVRESLNIANSSTMDTFYAPDVKNVPSMYGFYLTHMTLVEINGETKEVEGYLADSYEFNEDTNTYVFHLKEDAVFSNGYPVTAEDVVFTFEKLAESHVSSPMVACVTKVTADDEHTVSVEVTSPSIEFLYNLAMGNCSILSKQACEEEEEGYRIGCGPYVQTEWQADDYTLFERVEDYWNGTAPTKYIKYMKIAEASSRAIALQTGEIDVDLSLSTSEVASVEGDSNCKVYVEDGSLITYMFFNVSGENPALTDSRVRQAIAYAINCEDIIAGACEGYADVSTFIPNASIDTSEKDCTFIEQDVEKAKELLAEAGYADGFDMTIHLNSLTHATVVEIIQNQLAQVGINLTIACSDRTQMFSEFATGRGYESGILSMQFSNTPGRLGSGSYATGEVANYSNGSNEKVDELLENIFTTNSFEDRAEYAYELNEAMIEDSIFIPLYTSKSIYGVRSNVKDLDIYDGSMYVVFRNAYVED